MGIHIGSVVFCGRYVVTAVRDCVLPPISSKVVKYVIESSGSALGRVVDSRMSFKPISVGMLFIGNKPLYSTVSGNVSKPISVVRGSIMGFRLSLITSLDGIDFDSFRSIEGRWSTPYGEFNISLVEVEVVEVSKLSVGLGRFFRVSFITPTIITNKYMLPPTLRDKGSFIPERHRLVPQPSYLFSYLLRLWNSVVLPEERIPNQSAGDWEAYKLGRLSDIALVEVDYRLKPETVIIGRGANGRLRMVRGFTGWVTYECLSSKLLKVYDKLLALANYLGVGRSRGIGFGMISLTSSPS